MLTAAVAFTNFVVSGILYEVGVGIGSIINVGVQCLEERQD